MRIAFLLFLLAATGAGGAHAQPADAAEDAAERRPASSEPADEVVVRGRRLADFRVEVEQARIRAYDIFNEINSDDDFDVHCDKEARTGSRVGRQVCRARFEDRISARAGHEYLATLRWNCGDVTADCIFSEKAIAAISAAQGVESEAPGKRKLMKQEILRLAHENVGFAQAIIDYYEASLRYEEQRGRGRARDR